MNRNLLLNFIMKLVSEENTNGLINRKYDCYIKNKMNLPEQKENKEETKIGYGFSYTNKVSDDSNISSLLEKRHMNIDIYNTVFHIKLQYGLEEYYYSMKLKHCNDLKDGHSYSLVVNPSNNEINEDILKNSSSNIKNMNHNMIYNTSINILNENNKLVIDINLSGKEGYE
jgi:hypothetical protein